MKAKKITAQLLELYSTENNYAVNLTQTKIGGESLHIGFKLWWDILLYKTKLKCINTYYAINKI